MTGAVLWDLDGTLVDSEDYHWRAWRDTMSAEGIPITHEQFLQTFGLRNDEILPRWLGASATPARIQQVANAKEERYRRLVREEGLAPLPGAADWLERLHADGWRQAIASSAPRQNVEVVLEVTRLAECFQALVSAEDVTIGKPDPQVFLTAASRLNVPPSHCIVVEDAVAGVEAARRGGMRSIGVARNGKQLAADIAVASLADLPSDCFTRLLPSP
ncbi:MAG TPA: HAD family phosphatase [Bryobacteraceae bacterium]|nr:HAD family phosphatase [Bryobacteraceae bacterium]